MNPIIAFKDINVDAYYIEIKLKKYNDYTRLSLDKNGKIIIKVVNHILFINEKMFQYSSNKFLKFILNYNKISKGIEIFYLIIYIKCLEKVYLLDNKIKFCKSINEIF